MKLSVADLRSLLLSMELPQEVFDTSDPAYIFPTDMPKQRLQPGGNILFAEISENAIPLCAATTRYVIKIILGETCATGVLLKRDSALLMSDIDRVGINLLLQFSLTLDKNTRKATCTVQLVAVAERLRKRGIMTLLFYNLMRFFQCKNINVEMVNFTAAHESVKNLLGGSKHTKSIGETCDQIQISADILRTRLCQKTRLFRYLKKGVRTRLQGILEEAKAKGNYGHTVLLYDISWSANNELAQKSIDSRRWVHDEKSSEGGRHSFLLSYTSW